MAIAMLLITHVNWTHEGYELAWDNPVKIAVLNFFVVFVLLHVEGFKVVPIAFNCFLKPLQAVEHCALVVAFAFAGITVMQQLVLVLLKQRERMFSV